MAVAGRLEIELLANVARLQSDLNSGVGMVTRATQQMESAVAMVGKAFATLGVTLGVGAFTALIKGSIDAADHLNDLSKSTGIAVEQLAGLQIAAKQSGGDLDSISGSINKLNLNMAKSPEVFRALGVTAKDPLEAFKQLADVFSKLDDPQLRAALGAEALGKAWAGAAPLLMEGGKRIGEMVEQGQRLSRMTQEIATQADAFNDKLVLLTGTSSTANYVLNQMLPLLNALADGFESSSDKADGLQSGFNPLLEVFRVLAVLIGNIVFVIKGIGTEIETLGRQFVAVATRDFAGFKRIHEEAVENAEKARVAFDRWERSIMNVGTAAQTAANRLANMDRIDRLMASNARGAAREEAEAAAKKAKAALDAMTVRGRANDDAKRLAAEEKRLRDLDERSWAAYHEALEKQRAEASDAAVADLHKRNAELERLRKLDESGWAAYHEALERQRDAESDAIVADLHKRNAEIAKATKDLEDFLDPAKAKSFGDALSDGFGKAGSALGKLVVAFEALGRKEAELAKMRAENEKINKPEIRAANEIKLAEMSAQAQISAYGDMAGAAKGFFEAGTTGYKALEAAERVFRAFELAMAIQNMLTKSGLLTTFTSLFVASKATETAATIASVGPDVAASMAKGQAAAVAGVANQAQGEPYTAWIRMAAMAATMAALGFAISGSFGGGGGGGSSAAVRQRQQGTGTVLGDAEAKSNSLVNALEEIESIDRLGLVILHDQLEALRAIQAAMSGLATLIFRTTGLTTGEGFDVSTGTSVTARPGAVGGLDRINQSIADAIGIGSIVSGILGLWGKTSTEITDSGLQIAGSVRDLIAGLGINAYANVRTNSSSFFGLVRSSSESTETQAASDPVRRQIGMIFAGITDSVEAAAKALGIWFPQMSIDLRNFIVDIGKISFKDLKGQELEDAINAVFSTFADRLASTVLPTELLDQFQKVGEGAFETMVRLATENEVATNTLQALGLSVNAVGLAGLTARLRLVELMGGVEEFTEQTQSYFENYFSEVERHANLGANLNAEFVRLGVTMPTTTDGFRQLVEGLKLGTEEGDRMFAALMSINEPFAQWADSIVGLDGQLHTSAERNAQKMEAEDRLAVLKGTKTEQRLEREKEIAGAIDEYNLMLIRAIHAQEDFNAAAEAATGRRREEMSLEAELAVAQGDAAKALAITRALETEGMNAAELASYDYQESLRAQIEAVRLATEAEKTRADLNKQLFDLTHSEAEILANNRAIRLAELEAQEQAAGMEAGKLTDLQKQIDAAEDMNAAAKAAKEAADQAKQAWERFLQDAGVSVDGLADLFADRLSGESTQEEFAKGVHEMLVGGVYRAMANQTAAVVTQIISDNLMTPIMQSILQGSSVTAAINATLTQTNIDKMIDMATAAVEGLAAVFNDPAFKAAMQTFRQSIDGIVGSLSSLPGPVDSTGNPLPAGGHWDFSSGYGVWVTGGGSGGAAPPIDNSQDILRQKLELLARIYELTGDKAAAAAVLAQQQAMALAELDPSLRAFQTQLWGLEAAAEAAAKALEFTKTKRGLEIELQRALGNESIAIEMERADLITQINDEWGAGTQQAAELIALYQQLWQVQGQAGSATGDWIKTLQDWLNSNLLDDNLSPLTGQQQLVEAQRQFDLLKAQGAAVDAGALTRAADVLLAAQKDVTGFGGGYSAVFASVRDYISQLAPPIELPSVGESMIVKELMDMKAELRAAKEETARLFERLIETSRDGAMGTQDAVTKGAEKTATATTTAAVANERF